MRRLRSSLTYANVASSLALFLAVSGGTAIAAATITSADIQRSAVTKSKIARNAITASKVNNGAISNRDIRDESVTGEDLRNGTVTGDDLADGSVTGTDIRAGSIGAEALAPGVIPEAAPESGGGPAAHGVVTAAGALARGSGVATVSRPSDGLYAVTFARDVSACTPIASLGGTLPADDADGRVGGGSIAVAPSAASTATLLFEVRNPAGVDTPRPFSFVLYC